MLKYDTWGNLIVWLPVGKPCTITDDTHTYTIDANSIADYRSLKTAVGLPICVGHPKEPIAPNKPAKTVGNSLGETRSTPEGGVEIECKITDATTIEQIATKQLVEVSPCYVKGNDGIRIYNHLAVLPKGYARGGAQMAIRFEGSDTPLIKKNMTPEDISSICEGMKTMFQSMEKSEMESKKAMEESEMESKKSMEEACKESKMEGYSEGLDAAKWLTTAKSAGYEGSDVSEAKTAILANAYPDLKTEGYSSEMVEGLLLAATLKSTVVAHTAPIGEGKAVAVPTVRMEGSSEPALPSRYKHYVPKLKV